jgi:CRISPR-associated endonuclease/helicase Cas3
MKPLTFEDLFGFSNPTLLQAFMGKIVASADENRLLIAEAETGSGKTEVALKRFFDLFAAGEVEGLYFALPTRVAAKEIYNRVFESIQNTFPDESKRPSVLLAVPGYARIDGLNPKSILPGIESRFEDSTKWQIRERTWAAEIPKRFLAATIAVGTIDQALLSILQVPHAHLRSVCLDRHLLVVDEVHASDPYMRYLLGVLLEQHISIGGHTLLLSATLGESARNELLAATGVKFNLSVNSIHSAAVNRFSCKSL